MQENYELVQRGFRILVGSMSSYIGQEMNRIYKSKWWDEVLNTLYNQRDLPYGGDYGDLVDSLDIANCIRLLDYKWNDVFRDKLSQNCRTWARELMGVRNIVSHIGQQDLEQPMAERALDTMALLCREIDVEGAAEIRKIYREVRGRAADFKKVAFTGYKGLEQPVADSSRGELREGSLLQKVGTRLVQKTKLTRKVTYGNKTEVYPVYKVRLDLLFYNDQNDRIATWITSYEAENGNDSLSELNKEIYNRIIENFICESNPEAINKTQNNMKLVGQRVPGVTLADGRVVDGNRRLTCLRRLSRLTTEPLYFETVIMDMDIREDRKKIKLLELAIQHGEEKKVDYDLIDFAVGTYRDVVQTKLLTVEEYAASTTESVVEVRKRIETAGLISEFLDFIKLPGQYHIAREFQVYSLFAEMLQLLKRMDEADRVQLKKIAFNNVLVKAVNDQRKFIRDIKGLIRSDTYQSYFEEQAEINKAIEEKYAAFEIHSKEDIDRFAEENILLAEDMQRSMEKALLKSRSVQLRAKPAENVSKCITIMLDIDTRQFKRLDKEEKETLKAQLSELEALAADFKEQL